MSGGLHGVGVSVVNALSSRLGVQVDHGGNRYEMTFVDGGKPTGPLEMTGPSPRNRTGTTVTLSPDATVFDEVEEFPRPDDPRAAPDDGVPPAGQEIRFRTARSEQFVTYRYTGGVEDFVRHLNASKEALFRKVAYYAQSEDDQEIEVALQWNTTYYESIWSFANGIATIEGGMHEEGFKKALTNVVNRTARARGSLKDSDANIQGEDIREGLTAIISVRLRNPQFEGQTKAKLGNVTIRSLVERATNEKLAEWLDENPREASQILQKALLAQRARVTTRPAHDLAQVRPRRGGAPGQARRLCVTRSAGIRDLHRRGELGGRLREERP